MNKPEGGAIDPSQVTFRYDVRPGDPDFISRIVEATQFFSKDEIGVARELADEYLAKGEKSGYNFVFAEIDGVPAGYACFGPIPCTEHSFDLYWIAVAPEFQGAGLGRILIEKSEQKIRELGGARVYIETSSRLQYAPTRAFYDRCNYDRATVLEDFYAPGDGKVIFVKRIGN
ncbi:MAG: GNAT family N-acetyltransferase [Planctomycetota bacterium]